MTAFLLPNGKQQFIDANGNPLAGGSVYFYIPGTTTAKDTWQDSGQTILNTNPVVLDSSGQAIIYGNGTYRQIVKNASGSLIWDTVTDSPASVSYVDQQAAVAGGKLPTLTSADAYKQLVVKSDGSGFDLRNGGIYFSSVVPGSGLDVAAALNAEMTAADSISAAIIIPPGDYLVASSLVAPAGMRIIAYGARVYSTTNINLLDLSAGGCQVLGLELEGTGNSSAVSTGIAIKCAGTDNYPNAPTYVTGPLIRDVTIKNMSFYGVFQQFTTDARCENVRVYNVAYSGFEHLSCQRAKVVGCYVNGVSPGQFDTCYGLSFTRAIDGGRLTNLTAAPQSIDCSAENNVVWSNTVYEAFDTHSGVRISFINNKAYNCNVGISLSSDGQYGPKHCLVVGNAVYGTATGSVSGNSGIRVTGAASSGPTLIDYAEGCVVIGNAIVDFGAEANADIGGFWAIATKGLVVQGNTFLRCQPNAIALYYYNQNFNVHGNTIEDPWSNTVSAYGIAITSVFNSGSCGGNSFIRGNTSLGTNVFNAGMGISDNSSIQVRLTGDTFTNVFPAKYSIGGSAVILEYPIKQSGRGTFTTNTSSASVTSSVTFHVSFSTVPAVVVTSGSIALGTDILVSGCSSASTTGMSAVLATAGGSTFDSATGVDFSWQAEGY